MCVVAVVCEYLDLRPGNGGVREGHTHTGKQQRGQRDGLGLECGLGAASEVWMGKPKLA